MASSSMHFGMKNGKPIHKWSPFHPYFGFRWKFGTGLGLAVSKRIVEQHQGSLSFDTAPGLGTTFSIQLPVQQAQRGMAVS
jgi:nitrogen-specific signal transduction histidine kinase